MKKISLLIALMGLAGCQTTNDGMKFVSFPKTNSSSTMQHLVLPEVKSTDVNKMTTEQRVIYEGITALRSHDYVKASRLFNVALKMDVTHSEIHLMNALTYHLMAKDGDGSKYELAEEGYRLAVKFDENSWLAHYYFGLCSLDQRKYEAAQQSFASAAAIHSHDPNLLYDLAVASYYAHDPVTADGALRRLTEVDPKFSAQPKVVRTLAFVRATLNDEQGANESFEKLQQTEPASDLNLMKQRIDEWGSFYKVNAKSNDGMLLADNSFPSNGGFPSMGGGNGGFNSYPSGGSGSGSFNGYPTVPSSNSYSNTVSSGQFVDDKMVVVDVVIIGTQEDSRTTYGINLLNGLKLQFGDSSSLTPAISRGRNATTTVTDGVVSKTTTTTLSTAVRIPSVTYSLNIANAINGQDEVIAKPSLVALSGQTSDFFSGVEISAAAVSGGAGDSISIQKEIGVKLSVRPDFLPNNKVRLQVSAQRTFLTDPSNSVVFTYRLDTTKTNVNSNVVLKFGETLILSGLTERDVTKSNDGVPYLRNIPGLNLLFSERGTRDYQKSILILLTPRRPVYTAQSAEDRQAAIDGMSEYERSVERLQQRNKDWFPHQPSFEDVRKKIDNQDFFREFRTGDVQVDRWEKREANKQLLSQVVNDLI